MASMRKKKAKLNKMKLAELKSKNNEQEIVLDQQALDAIGDDLISSTVEGFTEELNKSPKGIQQLANKFSGLIQSFFDGFADGVRDELKSFAVAQNQTLKGFTQGLAKGVEDAVAPAVTPTPIKVKDYAAASTSILSNANRGGGEYIPGSGIARRATEWTLKAASPRAFGIDKMTERLIERNREKESWIQSEKILREKEFKERGLSSREIRKELKSDYKTIQKNTNTVKEISDRRTALERMGYTTEQANSILGSTQIKTEQDAIKTVAQADRSRVTLPGTSTTTLPTGGTEEQQQEDKKRYDDSFKQQDDQTELLKKIAEALGAKSTEKEPKSEDGDGMLGSLFGGMSKSLLGIFKRLFAPKALFKVISKFLAPAVIIGSLANGIIDGFKEFTKSGSIKEALIAGFGGILDFLTFGIFDKETIRGVVDFVEKSVNEYVIEPITKFADSMMEMFDEYISKPINGVIDFFKSIGNDIASFIGNLQIPEFSIDIPLLGKKTFGPWKPFESSTETTTNTINDSSTISKESMKSIDSNDSSTISKESMKSIDSVSSETKNLSLSSENFASKQISPTLNESPVNNESIQIAKEVGKNISVSVPPVIQSPGKQGGDKVVQQPFTNLIKNREPSVSDYLRSRYA